MSSINLQHPAVSAHPESRRGGTASRRPRKPALRIASIGMAAGLTISLGTTMFSANASTLKSAGSASILTIAGDDPGPFPSTENPYAVASDCSGLYCAFPNFVYEPLYQFDWLKPAEKIPWLATHYAWSDGGRAITFVIRSGVNWSDGEPFTAADVAFTYSMIEKYPEINSYGLPITRVSEVGANEVKLTFSKPAYSQFAYIASEYIVPEHIWKNYPNPTTAQNPHPVGTGPYMVASYSPQAQVLKPNPNYWGTKPHVQEIVESNIITNGTCDDELYTGQAQWGGCFLADFKKFKANKFNVFASTPESLVGLLPNLAVFPTNNLAFREAISLTINRKAVALAGDLGEDPLITSPTGLILPAQSAYMSPQYAHLSYQANLPKAKALLKAAGFKWSSSGALEAPNGTPVNVAIKVGTPYSDLVASAETMVEEFKAIGLHATVALEAPSALTVDEEDGKFQFAVSGTGGGLTPYDVYDGIMDSRLSAPIGKTAVGDFGRLNSAAADADLASFASSGSFPVQKKAIIGLEGIFMKELPFIPYEYGVAWGEYNTQHFTGWPSASDPYAMGTSYFTPEDELVILHLRPRA